MKRKGLYFLIALALGGVGAAHAQDTTGAVDTASSSTEMATDYDARWYIAPTVGGYYNDTDRNTNSRQVYYGLGVGRFISPNASIDIFADRTKRDADGGGSWANNTVGVAARFYAGAWNSWRPYVLAGVMGSHHQNAGDHGWSPAAELGGGLSKTITDSSDIRMEAGCRIIDKTGPLANYADRDHCIQYMVAVPLIFGRLVAGDYSDDVAADPRIDALRDKMTVSENPQFTRDYFDPAKRYIGNAVQEFLKDGSSKHKV
jgi:hypothetical protein